MTEPGAPSDETPAQTHDVATGVATQTLLNLFMLEGGQWRPVPAADVPDLAAEGEDFVAVIPFPDLRAVLLVGVQHLSPTHRHRFRLPAELAVAGGNPVAVGFDTLAGMLVDQIGDTGEGDALSAGGTRGPDPTALLAEIRHSVASVGSFLAARDEEIDALWDAEPMSFIASEQALLLGHDMHPTPKSRLQMSAEQIDAYGPESAARFQLHWLAVGPSLVEHDSALDTRAPQLTEQLLRDDPAVDVAALDAALEPLGERVLLPAHPWELGYLREHDDVAAALLADGQITDLGPLGSPVSATSSVRTVYEPAWPWQLKLSLHVRVTNALRVTRERELLRAVEGARLLGSEVGERVAEIAPDLVFLREPAFLLVRHGGELINGFSVLLRENRWTEDAGGDDVSAIAVLCQRHPYGGRSRLAQIVSALAAREGRSEDEVARAWFERYAEVVIVPLVRLYLELGLCLEPHQQNVLLELDGGLPARAVYRDGRIFHRAAAHDDLVAVVPGLGEGSDSGLEEQLAEAHLIHYLFLNNALGVVSALGSAGLADEPQLLRDLRALLERERERESRYPATVLDRLIDDETWPVKGNLRARLNDLDELSGGILNSTIFVSILNPLLSVSR